MPRPGHQECSGRPQRDCGDRSAGHDPGAYPIHHASENRTGESEQEDIDRDGQGDRRPAPAELGLQRTHQDARQGPHGGRREETDKGHGQHDPGIVQARGRLGSCGAHCAAVPPCHSGCSSARVPATFVLDRHPSHVQCIYTHSAKADVRRSASAAKIDERSQFHPQGVPALHPSRPSSRARRSWPSRTARYPPCWRIRRLRVKVVRSATIACASWFTATGSRASTFLSRLYCVTRRPAGRRYAS